MEKSKWFYTEYKEDTQAVVLLVHGLNLLPSKMDELARFFNSKKCDVYRISLGHDPALWEDKFSEDYNVALEHSEILNRPLYFAGYSLGALIGINFVLNHSSHQFKKLLLLAPAIHSRFYTKIPALLSYLLSPLFQNASLPSFNLKNYRNKKNTTLIEYQFMHKFQNEIKKHPHKKELDLPTLLITSRKDELVSSSKLRAFSKHFSLWQCHEVTNKDSQQIKKYHHLMITEENLGQIEWQKMLHKITTHFSL